MDLTRAENTPWTPSSPHALLAAFAGRWSGRTRTWLDPTRPPEESETWLDAGTVLGGRFLRIGYRSAVTGGPHAGEFVLGWDGNERRWTVAWFDSFHTGTGVMSLLGDVGDEGPPRVLGSYRAGEERWGWRTAFVVEGDRLVIAATNVWPDGREDRAVETVLERVR